MADSEGTDNLVEIGEAEDSILPNPKFSLSVIISKSGETTHVKLMPTCHGFILSLLGAVLVFVSTAEVVVIPLALSDERVTYPILIDKHNLFGFGIWSGLLIVIVGACAIRTTITQRQTSLQKFFTLSIINYLLTMVLLIIRIVYYAGHQETDWIAENVKNKEHFAYTVFYLQIVSDVLLAVCNLPCVHGIIIYWRICCKRSQYQNTENGHDSQVYAGSVQVSS